MVITDADDLVRFNTADNALTKADSLMNIDEKNLFRDNYEDLMENFK